jgi:hypothetical protein
MNDMVEIAKNAGNYSALGPAATAAKALKATLGARIVRILDARSLTVRAAAEASGYAAADFSRLRRGKLDRFTVDRLLAMLAALDPDIELNLILRPRLRRDSVIAALKVREADFRAEGATALLLFGSTARDEAGVDSDVDLLVDYDDGSNFSLLELVGMKQLIERDLGVDVHIATRDSLQPAFRERIEHDAIRIF